MSTRSFFRLLLLVAASLSGCRTYDYRIVRPSGGPSPVAKQPVTLRCEPLDYQLARRDERLTLRIFNLTDDRLMLVESRSYVVDPHGESHPIRSRVLAPHSFVVMSLPPAPRSCPYPYYFAYPYPAWAGYGWGWYGPYWYRYRYDPLFWPPPAYYEVLTRYDWEWNTGLVRLHLTYDRDGKTIEHDFEFVREQAK
jgi:hypothetical protein